MSFIKTGIGKIKEKIAKIAGKNTVIYVCNACGKQYVIDDLTKNKYCECGNIIRIANE